MLNIRSRSHLASDEESGFTIIEIVVSMFLLALLAMFFLPLLVQGMKTSVQNANLATASQLVSQQLDIARALPDNCDAVSSFDDAPVAVVSDSRGNYFQPYRQVGACPVPPAHYPAVVKVTAWVTEVGDTRHLAEAVTLVYLSSESAPTP